MNTIYLVSRSTYGEDGLQQELPETFGTKKAAMKFIREAIAEAKQIRKEWTGGDVDVIRRGNTWRVMPDRTNEDFVISLDELPIATRDNALKVAKAAKAFLNAQDDVDNYVDDYPCIDAYDEEYKTRTTAKWDAYGKLNALVAEILKKYR